MSANGNGKGGLIAGISDKLIRALPPAFLMLLIMNVVFLGVTWWVFAHNADQRNALLTKIVESCLLNKPEQR